MHLRRTQGRAPEWIGCSVRIGRSSFTASTLYPLAGAAELLLSAQDHSAQAPAAAAAPAIASVFGSSMRTETAAANQGEHSRLSTPQRCFKNVNAGVGVGGIVRRPAGHGEWGIGVPGAGHTEVPVQIWPS